MRYSRDGWSVEAGLAKGRKPPEWYLNRPGEVPTDEFYMAAFWDLSTCRAIGMSLGPIPWHHIRDYALFAGLDRDNAFAFSAIMRKLDVAYLDLMEKRQAGGSGGPMNGRERPAADAPVKSILTRGGPIL